MLTSRQLVEIAELQSKVLVAVLSIKAMKWS